MKINVISDITLLDFLGKMKINEVYLSFFMAEKLNKFAFHFVTNFLSTR